MKKDLEKILEVEKKLAARVKDGERGRWPGYGSVVHLDCGGPRSLHRDGTARDTHTHTQLAHILPDFISLPLLSALFSAGCGT